MIELFAISALLLWWLHRRRRRKAVRNIALQLLYIQNAIINVGRQQPPTVKSPRYRLWRRP